MKIFERTTPRSSKAGKDKNKKTKTNHKCVRCQNDFKIVHTAPKASVVYGGKRVCKDCLDSIKAAIRATSPATRTYQAVGSKAWQRRICHEGNHLIFPYGDKGGALYAGGWNRGADPEFEWGVIDLASLRSAPNDNHADIEALNKSGDKAFARSIIASTPRTEKAGPWLSLPIPDFGIPDTLDRKFWLTLADDIKKLLDRGTSVQVCCFGGHGRTGMVICILTGILRPELITDQPVKWIRDLYCDEAVETLEQQEYIYKMLDRPVPSWLATRVEQASKVTKKWIQDNAVVVTEGKSPKIKGKQVVHTWEYDDGTIVYEYADGTQDIDTTNSKVDYDSTPSGSVSIYDANKDQWADVDISSLDEGVRDFVLQGDKGRAFTDDSLANTYEAVDTSGIPRAEVFEGEFDALADQDCPDCDGKGYVDIRGPNGECEDIITCPRCDGFGDMRSLT